MGLRQQARAGTVYAPGLTYAPPPSAQAQVRLHMQRLSCAGEVRSDSPQLSGAAPVLRPALGSSGVVRALQDLLKTAGWSQDWVVLKHRAAVKLQPA